MNSVSIEAEERQARMALLRDALMAHDANAWATDLRTALKRLSDISASIDIRPAT